MKKRGSHIITLKGGTKIDGDLSGFSRHKSRREINTCPFQAAVVTFIYTVPPNVIEAC
jgi:hypothetical protein